jgi:hypothetical protein
MGVANSVALKIAGIDKNTNDPEKPSGPLLGLIVMSHWHGKV